MINVMIVDDEVDILYGAQMIIDWNKLGFNLCGLCNNSYEALEVFRRNLPDIVITDIRMPDIDGLTLAKLIKQECNDTKVIILSGYDDFNYAKTAISIGVSGYLLKPLDEIELSILLNKLKEEITLQKVSTHTDIKVDNALNHKIISQLLSSNTLDSKQIKNLRLKRVQLIIAKPDTPFLIGVIENSKFEEDFKQLSIYLRNETTIYYEQLFEETAIFVIEPSDNFTITREKLELSRISSTFSLAISPIITDIKTLRDVYVNIRTALDIDILFGLPGGIYNYRTMPLNMAKPPLYEFDFDKCKEELFKAMLSMDSTDVRKLFSYFLNIIRKNREHISAEMARMFWERLTLYAREILKQTFQAHTDILEDFDFGCDLMKHFPSMQQISEHLYTIISNTLNSIYEASWKNMNITVRQIMLYIRMNACNDISLKKVAEKFYLNQSYLSRIFREKTGTTFWTYVTEMRLEKAKEMLKNEYLSLYEIAHQCGFNNVKRLHAVFKKYLGCTPGEYRKQVAYNDTRN
ncbi:MAG TPA: response regulator [Clostridiaceae bacterium]|nr:response regulator [Clostridiaceae bacterium]